MTVGDSSLIVCSIIFVRYSVVSVEIFAFGNCVAGSIQLSDIVLSPNFEWCPLACPRSSVRAIEYNRLSIFLAVLVQLELNAFRSYFVLIAVIVPYLFCIVLDIIVQVRECNYCVIVSRHIEICLYSCCHCTFHIDSYRCCL